MKTLWPTSAARQAKQKAKWVNAYCVSDPSRLDTATLRAYIPFARTASAFSYLPTDVLNDLYTELATRPDLNPYYRQAIELTLTQYQPA